MKKQLLLSVAAGALAVATSSAMAAPPLPVYNWTGFYAGGNAGYSWGRGATTYTDNAFSEIGAPTTLSGSNKLNGGLAGIQFGYNWQVGTSWVWGFETDFQYTAEKATAGFNFPYSDCEGPSCNVNGSLSSRFDWFGTVRGRLGWLATPTTLIYATGGFAYGRVTATGLFSDNGCFPSACTWSFGQSAINTGWAAGGGIEAAFPQIADWNVKNWTWKIEYLYIDLGSLSGSGSNSDFGTYSWNARFTDSILRFGVNYRIP